MLNTVGDCMYTLSRNQQKIMSLIESEMRPILEKLNASVNCTESF